MKRKLNPDWISAVQEIVGASPFIELLNMKIRHLDWGVARVEIELETKHLQPFGVVHGGVCATLIDATAFWAVATQIDQHQGLTTTEMKLNYLAPTERGRLIGYGSAIKTGKTLCLGEARVEDETGRLIAHGTAGFMRLSGFSLKSNSHLPEKYI